MSNVLLNISHMLRRAFKKRMILNARIVGFDTECPIAQGFNKLFLCMSVRSFVCLSVSLFFVVFFLFVFAFVFVFVSLFRLSVCLSLSLLPSILSQFKSGSKPPVLRASPTIPLYFPDHSTLLYQYIFTKIVCIYLPFLSLAMGATLLAVGHVSLFGGGGGGQAVTSRAWGPGIGTEEKPARRSARSGCSPVVIGARPWRRRRRVSTWPSRRRRSR